METSHQNHEDGVTANLRRQLALAVKSIQWSYAISWSISSTQPGNSRFCILEWGDGYYNGDIKTRKTIQTAEVNADQLGLQRSEQLRELYESLSGAESNPQAKRPSAALSPEDLTDTEWYFLVCMSFVFNIGEGLPGRSLAKNQTIWLCNAHQADSKVFSRSLLAKSASIKTVICFPYQGSVVELGVTELVLEDRNLIQHIKTNFLDNPYPVVSQIPNYVPDNNNKGNDIVVEKLDDDTNETNFSPLVECGEETNCSPDNSTTGSEANQHAEETYMVEGKEGPSQVQCWQFMDDEISNCFHDSMTPSDSISQTYATPRKGVPLSNEEKINNDFLHELHKCNQKKPDNFDFRSDDIHYQSVLSTLLKSSHQLILGPYFRNNNKESSFVCWKKERTQVTQTPRGGTAQRILKKVLFEVSRMHGDWMLEPRKDDGKSESIWRPEADEIDNNHVLAERKRREKLNERFMILGSLVPLNGKVDKISILDHTIEYMKELERRIEELESRKETTGLEARTRRRAHEGAERISDNYCSNKTGKNRKSLINKRKASDVEEMKQEAYRCALRESSSDGLTVRVIDKNVLIEIKCPWREYLLLEIMEAISDLNLDSQAVQSSNTNGILSLTIKSKFKGSKVASPIMFRQALQRVVRKS